MDPVFPLNCPDCNASSAPEPGNLPSLHLCGQCQRPLPLSGSENFFSIFGLKPSLSLDPAHLEKTFYALSRLLHPDRFAGAPTATRLRSIERMTYLNQSFRTLKDPALRRQYLLKWANFSPSFPASGRPAGTSPIPEALTEAWFELDRNNAEQARKFIRDFSEHKEEHARKVASLEERINSHLNQSPVPLETLRPLLEELSVLLQAENYLKSLERNLQKLKT